MEESHNNITYTTEEWNFSKGLCLSFQKSSSRLWEVKNISTNTYSEVQAGLPDLNLKDLFTLNLSKPVSTFLK